MESIREDVENETFFTSLETIAYVIMQISFLVTAMGLPYHRNHRRMTSLPFIALAIHCFIWSIHHVRHSNAPHIIPNFSGLIVGIIGVITYQSYSKIKVPMIYIGCSVVTIIITCILAYLNMYDAVSAVGAVSILVMMLSQLPSVPVVLNTQTSASVPMAMAATIPINGLMQMLYNVYIAHNFFTAEAYGIGVVFSLLQLLLFIYYKPPADEDVHGFTLQRDESEMDMDDEVFNKDDDYEEVIFEGSGSRGGQMMMQTQIRTTRSKEKLQSS